MWLYMWLSCDQALCTFKFMWLNALSKLDQQKYEDTTNTLISLTTCDFHVDLVMIIIF